MFGVADYAPRPPALKTIIQLLKLKLPTVPSLASLPSSDTAPTRYIVVERVGGTETAQGYISEPSFAFQCYAPDTGAAEDLCELLLSILKSAQFTKVGNVQLRYFTPTSLPANFPDPRVPGKRRWQFSGTFTLN